MALAVPYCCNKENGGSRRGSPPSYAAPGFGKAGQALYGFRRWKTMSRAPVATVRSRRRRASTLSGSSAFNMHFNEKKDHGSAVPPFTVLTRSNNSSRLYHTTLTPFLYEHPLVLPQLIHL
jgi:hypothetical protein